MFLSNGSKVRYVGESRYDLTKDKIYTISTYRGDDNFKVIDDIGEENGIVSDNFEVVGDEVGLKELRAWKQAALARFPELKKPESDEDFCRRLANDNSGEGYQTLRDAFQDAIDFGRANPR